MPRSFAVFLLLLQFTSFTLYKPTVAKPGKVFSKNNLVAWCIVPYDDKKRGPEERAQMLNKLGIIKFAYDWRETQIVSAGEELDAIKKHHIQLQAFWMPYGPSPEKNKHYNEILDQLKKHRVKTQLWWSYGSADDGLKKKTQEEKVKLVGEMVKTIATDAAKIGCTVGLYNHNGWFGEPENMLAVLAYVNMKNVGIVYNFNHAENQAERFSKFFPSLLPHLIALNIAGIEKGKPNKIVPVGQGDYEKEMIRIAGESTYSGPIGIINEDTDPDAETGLTINIEGLKLILQSLGYTDALRTYK